MAVLREYGIIRESAYEAANAAMTAVNGLQEGRIQGEVAFTDRMIGAIEDRFRNLVVKGVQWSALTLTGDRRNSQETDFGADFMGVLEISLPNFSVKKGFLAQSKLFAPDHTLSQEEWDRLISQCGDMLHHTPDSFVFLYTKTGIDVVPAVSVMGLAPRTNPHALYTRSVQRFFEEHFECFIGDRKIHRATQQGLEDLAASIPARRTLLLRAFEPAR